MGATANHDSQAAGVPRVIGGLGVILGLCVTPPVAGRVFALGPLHAVDWAPLWALAGGLMLIGVLLAVGPKNGRTRTRLAALSLPFFALIASELGARLVLDTDGRMGRRMIELANRCYSEETVFMPHPFLQFTGRPGIVRENDRVDRGGGFNASGFTGPDVARAKPEGTLRVVCLGGSTTAGGYPGAMRVYLGDAPWGSDGPEAVEVLNFGVARYASTHSVVNFVLNAVDFEPDYVVFHHAWNDHWARDREGPARGDGFHFMREFRYPEISDGLLIRGSLLYRYFKDRVDPAPSWTFLTDALVVKAPQKSGPRYQNLEELEPYERNVRTVVETALARGMVPVLVTMPHATDPGVSNFHIAEHIDQCNEIVRVLAAEFGERVVFVDLDRQVTGVHEEFFRDLGHMRPPGIVFKAAAIGQAILDHARAGR